MQLNRLTALFSIGLAAAASSSVAMPSAPRAVRGTSGAFGGWRSYRSGPGWTHAQVQRMARKRRNQQRHKAQCRRSR